MSVAGLRVEGKQHGGMWVNGKELVKGWSIAYGVTIMEFVLMLSK